MKLSGFLLPAVAGLAAAYETADFYLLPPQLATPSTNARSSRVSKHAAQAILQQRLSLDWRLPTHSAPDAIRDINLYGKTTRPLFDAADATDPRQLVLVYRAANDADLESSRQLPITRGFAVAGMTASDLPPARTEPACNFVDMINPESKHCWKSTTQYLEYDVSKEPDALRTLEGNLDLLKSLAASNKMETLIVVLPASTNAESTDELRRRASEEVMVEDGFESSSSSSVASSADTSSFNPLPFVAKKGPVPACFTTANDCITTTANCSGHGECRDKFQGSSIQCWSCHCLATNEKGAKSGKDVRYHWGGNQCQKIDVSTPFWLFAGFTVVMLGLVGGAIGLLFSVGEEKLPGVIGAGVSRTTK